MRSSSDSSRGHDWEQITSRCKEAWVCRRCRHDVISMKKPEDHRYVVAEDLSLLTCEEAIAKRVMEG